MPVHPPPSLRDAFQKRFALLLLFAALAFFPACRLQSDVNVIKLGHGLDSQHPVHLGMVHMADRVADLSDGQMQIDIYPSGQLGSERETLELLQIGSLGMTKVSAAVLEAFAPQFQVFSLPYIFHGDDHLFGVLDSEIGQSILESTRDFNLVGLGYYDAGFRSFYARRPINTPEDLRGMKIRVQESPGAIRMVRALGGAPTPVSWGELYTALQQGIVDGAENNSPSFYLSLHYEVSRYFSLNEHTAVPDVLVISSIVWDGLSEQEQEWLRVAAAESIDYQRDLWHEAEQDALDAVEAAGVAISRPDLQPFRDAVQPLIEAHLDHDVIGPLIRQIRAFEPETSPDDLAAAHIN